MSQINHFAYGLLTPAMAYLMSVVGSSLGLICTRRSRQAKPGWKRIQWLALAATSIGGAGIWLMHFLAMIGFTVKGAQIRYDLFTTGGSALLAILVVGLGLYMVSHGERSFFRLLAAGVFMGLGVAGMHYTGMAAMRVQGNVYYDPALVVASLVVAIAAATVALWFALVVDGVLATGAAAFIMGIAVAGMHYTGMAAVGVNVHIDHNIDGTQLINILMPVFLSACVVLIVPLCIFLALDTEEPTRHAAKARRSAATL